MGETQSGVLICVGVLLVILVIVIIWLFFYFHSPEAEPSPKVIFKIDKTRMVVQSDSISDLVTAELTLNEEEKAETSFELRFSNKETIYATDEKGNRISNLTTKPMKDNGARDTKQFKIFSKKCSEDDFAEKSLKIDLLAGDKILEDQAQTMVLTVK